MKKKAIFVYSIAAILGFGGAFASIKQTAVLYYQPTPGSGNTWAILTEPYDPNKCKENNSTFCIYAVVGSHVLPSNPTTSQLVAAGGVPLGQNRKYLIDG